MNFTEQINNLRIKKSKSGVYKVYTPDKRCIEEFKQLIDAERFCKETLDFVRMPRKQNILDAV